MGKCKYLLVLLVLCSCRVNYQSPSVGFPRIDIAEGGGFTGLVTTYTLMKNGQVFMSKSTWDSAKRMEPISKRQARSFYKEVKQLIAEGEAIHEPDNIYKVLRYVEKDTTYEVLWYHNRPLLDSAYYRILRGIEEANKSYE